VCNERARHGFDCPYRVFLCSDGIFYSTVGGKMSLFVANIFLFFVLVYLIVFNWTKKGAKND